MELLAVLVRSSSLLRTLQTDFLLISIGSSQPVGGKHVSDPSKFSEQELHPGMNPDPAERGRQLGHANAQGGQSIGTGGHGAGGPNMGK